MDKKIENAKPKEKRKIMIIDDNITNLTVAKKALETEYTVIPVTSGENALTLLERISPSLILLDIEMPGMNGFETLAHIKKKEHLQDIPVLFLTAKDDFDSEFEGLRLGAVDYITKPFLIPLLLQRIELHIKLVSQKHELQNYNQNLEEMVKEKTHIIAELQHAVVHTLSELVESRDGCTGEHIHRTQKYLETLIMALQDNREYRDDLDQLNLNILIESAQLHDIGKIAVPDSILKKTDRLTNEEFEIIKKHTINGEKSIKRAMRLTRAVEFLNYAAEIAVSHHERWDGSGYPYGLKDKNIPFSGRLMAIADVYDALVSRRPYKLPFPHEKAVKIIAEESGKHFDPNLVEAFIKASDDFKKILLKTEGAKDDA